MVKLSIRDVDKIFGPKPKSVLKHVKQGMPKSEILLKTGHTVGVYNVNIDVEEGEFFVIMGLSGSGKSTLVRCINRLIEPTSGEIFIDDVDVLKCDQEALKEVRRSKVSMVFQKFGLLPHKTILENVMFGLEIQGVDFDVRKEKATQTIEMVGLKGYEESYPDELSGGMQQRVGLARALTNDPDIILMDEAFSALDPLIRKQMQDEILSIQSNMKKTIIFITHDLDEALKLGDRIAIMRDGEVVQVGTPEDILMEPANKYVENFVQEVNRSKVITAGSIMKSSGAIVLPKDGFRMAVRKMEEMDISSIFAIARDNTFKGVINIEDAVKGLKSPGADIEEVISKEKIYTTLPDVPIENLFPYAAETSYPIAVVDENQKLLGIITRATLIKNMY